MHTYIYKKSREKKKNVDQKNICIQLIDEKEINQIYRKRKKS